MPENNEYRPPTLSQLVLGNGFLLSGLYLFVGGVTEALRRVWSGPRLVRFSFALDALPWQVLERTGAGALLREAYTWGRITPFQIRLIFGATTIVVIFTLATVLGTLLWNLQGLGRRPLPPPPQ